MAFNTNIIHVLLEDEVQNNGNGGEIKGENQKKSVVNQWPHHEGAENLNRHININPTL